MKTTGITRRIDDLGRIVIPKEIRKNMHLKTGELLEIFLNDSDTITLKKHSIINRKEEFIEQYVKLLSVKINADIYITSLNEIVFSNVNDLIGEKISNEFETLLLNNSSVFEINNLKITSNKKIIKPILIHLLRPNGDLVGSVIFNFKDGYDQKDEQLIKFSTALLEKYFEIFLLGG